MTGALVGEVWSCEISPFRVPTLLWKRKATSRRALSRVRPEPCAVRAPRHASTCIARDLGGPRVARQGRVRKADMNPPRAIMNVWQKKNFPARPNTQ